MFIRLMRTRRFASLFWCQFLSAFNDNFVRNLLAMFILFRVGADGSGALVTLAVGIFIAPSIFLSGLGGELADGFDKARVARWLKLAEVCVQMIAAAGVLTNALLLLYIALGGLGIIAALFGPLKYAILPDLTEREDLPAANALVEAATFLAILLGLLAGGLAAAEHRSTISIALQLAIIALACWATSLLIPATTVAAPGLRPRINLFASTMERVREVRANRTLMACALAISWFWAVGAVTLALIPVVLRDRGGANVEIETAASGLFACGIALGSLIAARLAHGRLIRWPIPLGALIMALGLGCIWLGTLALIATPGARLLSFFSTGPGALIAGGIALLAAGGGLFVVPVYTIVLSVAEIAHRARVVAGINILNSIFIVVASLAASLLQSSWVSIDERSLLAAIGLANIAVALICLRIFTRDPQT